MTPDPNRIKEIFLAATELPDQAAQAAYLDQECAGDADLRQRVETLLRSHEPAGSFLATPAAMVTDSDSSATTALAASGSNDGSTNQSAKDEALSLEFLSPSSRPDALGRIGHYDVLQVLGQGGFGIVFRAFDDTLQRVVAIKVMSPQMAATSPARKRFLREARSSAQVRHEHVVQVHYVEEQPLPYLVMEFIPGETLQQRLDRVGPLDVQETLRVGRQIAEGLAAAHSMDLIHRDIKPGNVLLEGGQYKVKITDFGLARAADDASMTQSGMIAGTPMYMAPEQALGQTLDQRADLFSLGSVLYQMVAGRPPFRANNTVAVLKRVAEDTPRDIREIIAETPQWLCDIIAKLHAKNPDERFQSAREVADLLADCEAQLKTNSRLQDFSRIPRGTSKAQSSVRWKLGAVAAAVLLAVMAFGWSEFTGATHFLQGRAARGTIQSAVAPALDPKLVAVAETETSAQEKSAPESSRWVQLFNGKDLSGWKTSADAPGHWEVKDGVLVGSERRSYLYSERGDYENFHLRLEAKINRGGDSGILFRAKSSIADGGYEAEINKNPKYARKTGSISALRVDAPPLTLGLTAEDSLFQADDWFTLEIIADRDRLITKVNGIETANCSDLVNSSVRGHLGLQVWSAGTIVQFRKIEIKERPPSPPPADAFVALFNGKDLTGWKTHPDQPGEWKVEKGMLIGSTIPSYLYTDGGKFENFHLRVEAKINRGGDSSVFFRAPFAVRQGRFAGSLRPAGGYEVELHRTAGYEMATGTVWNAESSGAPKVLGKAADGSLTKDDEWFVLEIIAHTNRILTKVNGIQTAHCEDPEKKFPAGHFALQVMHPQTTVQFRKIEIMELPSFPPGTAATAVSPSTGADVQRIAALSAAEQVEEVRKELQRLNPNFDGKLIPTMQSGVVTELSFNSDEVEDIAPVRAFTKLVDLDCRGTYPNNGKLSDLSPLKGMQLRRIDCSSTQISDLSPLTGMPLTYLQINHNPISDLTPLAGMPLRNLGCAETSVSDFSALKGLKLTFLGAQLLAVTDLTPLKGMPLKELDLYHTVGVTSLEALAGMPLENLNLQDVPVSDLSPLAGMTTLRTLLLEGCKVADLSPLAGLKLTNVLLHDKTITDLSPLRGQPLTRLTLDGTGVSDLRPLLGMPLVEIRLNPENITQGLDILREMKTLTTIGIDGNRAWPAAEFWQRYEKGEFGR